MKIILLSFIGIAINIWRDTSGTGGGGLPSNVIRQRDGAVIYQRNGQYITTRA